MRVAHKLNNEYGFCLFRRGAIDPSGGNRSQVNEDTFLNAFRRMGSSELRGNDRWEKAPFPDGVRPNDWPARKLAVDSLLCSNTPAPQNLPMLVISPRCKRLIKAMLNWKRMEKGEGDEVVLDPKPQPSKLYNGVGMALCYGCLLVQKEMKDYKRKESPPMPDGSEPDTEVKEGKVFLKPSPVRAKIAEARANGGGNGVYRPHAAALGRNTQPEAGPPRLAGRDPFRRSW